MLSTIISPSMFSFFMVAQFRSEMTINDWNNLPEFGTVRAGQGGLMTWVGHARGWKLSKRGLGLNAARERGRDRLWSSYEENDKGIIRRVGAGEGG